MEATRVRFGSILEWIIAAACIVAALVVVSLLVRELRTVPTAVPVLAREGAAVVRSSHPAGIPARAVSVPVLQLPGNTSVRVGDSVRTVAARLGRQAEIGSQTVEPSRFGERLTRFYEHAGSRFVLVFEPTEERGEPKVAAIYLQE
jgi:hypothetical protein